MHQNYITDISVTLSHNSKVIMLNYPPLIIKLALRIYI